VALYLRERQLRDIKERILEEEKCKIHHNARFQDGAVYCDSCSKKDIDGHFIPPLERRPSKFDEAVENARCKKCSKMVKYSPGKALYLYLYICISIYLSLTHYNTHCLSLFIYICICMYIYMYVALGWCHQCRMCRSCQAGECPHDHLTGHKNRLEGASLPAAESSETMFAQL
jgi:hypothetical protein